MTLEEIYNIEVGDKLYVTHKIHKRLFNGPWVIAYKPDILIAGHNQFDNKACPSFFVPTYLKMIGIPDKNIYTKDPFGYATKLS